MVICTVEAISPEALREARRACGLSQADLAEQLRARLGRRHQSAYQVLLSRFETRRTRTLPADVVAVIAATLGLPAAAQFDASGSSAS